MSPVLSRASHGSDYTNGILLIKRNAEVSQVDPLTIRRIWPLFKQTSSFIIVLHWVATRVNTSARLCFSDSGTN